MSVVALGTVGAVAVGEVGKLWRRRVIAEEPVTAPEVIQKGARAARDTVERGEDRLQRGDDRRDRAVQPPVGVRALVEHGQAHHVRGAQGSAAALQRPHRPPAHPSLRAGHPDGVRGRRRRALQHGRPLRETLAIPLGVGIGLTFDESALLLELEDVYWTREGLVGVQITLATASLLAASMLALRILRRGERTGGAARAARARARSVRGLSAGRSRR